MLPHGSAGGSTILLALDALGRAASRTTGASVDTYTYQADTNTVLRIANTGGSGATTDSLTDAAGTRLGTRIGAGAPAWPLPDPSRRFSPSSRPS
jgi:hypothetical protein